MKANQNFLKSWTSDLIDELKTLAAQKLTPRLIAEKLGRTRNAILGICRREGIAIQTRRKAAKPQKPRQEQVLRLKRYKAEPTHGGVPMLSNTGCKYIIGEPRFQCVCGATRLAGKSYCPTHHKACHLPPRVVD